MSSATFAKSFKPTPEQYLALTHPTPLLVLAGAGTGKTTVLTQRIAQSIASGAVRPHQVLALTFTQKAAAEMAERLERILGELGQGMVARETFVGTFHSFGGRVIRENLLRLGFDRVPAVATAAAAWQLLASIFDELSFDTIEVSTGTPSTVFGQLLHVFSQCQDHLISPEDLERYAASLEPSTLEPAVANYMEKRRNQIREVAAAYRRYALAKQEKCLIDFGDHLYLPARLFRECRDVRDAYRRRFPFIFVDEYQDTNYAQRALLMELIDPDRPGVMVIGDDDQAIYRWRGAVVQNILRFPEESIFQPGQVKCAPITLNRRSLPPILDLANLAISTVRARHAKELRYHEERAQGRATVAHYVAASDQREAEWIAAKIRQLEPETRETEGRKRGYGAFAVLCRKRSLFEPIGRALERASVPYELIGGTGFYGRWEIRDVLSYLLLLTNPADDLAVARILRSRRLRISGRDIFHLGQWMQRENGYKRRGDEGRPEAARLHLLDGVLSCEEVPGLSAEACARLINLRAELGEYAQASQRLTVGDFVTHVINRTGYRDELRAQTGFDARLALLNLEKLEDMARQVGEGSESVSLAGFVDWVRYALESGEEEGEVRPVDEDSNTVKVMSIHQAKGLEFPIVFIPGLADSVFPTQLRDQGDKWYEIPFELRGDRDCYPRIDFSQMRTARDLERALDERKEAEKLLQLDEERRLFYVAITRAQQQLYFTRAHWYGSTIKPREPSPFWDIVVSSGLSRDEGAEECPTENPNLVGRSALASSRGEGSENGDASLESLLLNEDDCRRWIENAARRDGYGRWTVLRADVDAHLAALAVAPASGEPIEKIELSCSGLLLYWNCPRHYRFAYLDCLPSRPLRGARVGREVHRWIEELSRPMNVAVVTDDEQKTPEEEERGTQDDELRARFEELVGSFQHARRWSEHSVVADLVASFRESVYGGRQATYVEWPFRLSLDRGWLRGRIDRLDLLPDGRWEIVDFKSSAFSESAAAVYRQQLALYTLAVRELRRVPVERVSAHLFFLKGGRDLELKFDDDELDKVRARSETALAAIAEGEFPRTPGSQICANCWYSHLCTCS